MSNRTPRAPRPATRKIPFNTKGRNPLLIVSLVVAAIVMALIAWSAIPGDDPQESAASPSTPPAVTTSTVPSFNSLPSPVGVDHQFSPADINFVAEDVAWATDVTGSSSDPAELEPCGLDLRSRMVGTANSTVRATAEDQHLTQTVIGFGSADDARGFIDHLWNETTFCMTQDAMTAGTGDWSVVTYGPWDNTAPGEQTVVMARDGNAVVITAAWADINHPDPISPVTVTSATLNKIN